MMIRFVMCVVCVACMGFADCELPRVPHPVTRETRANGVTQSDAVVVRETSTIVVNYEDNRNSMTYDAWCDGVITMENVSDQSRNLMYHLRIPMFQIPFTPSFLDGFCYEEEADELVYHVERVVAPGEIVSVEFSLLASWDDYNPGGADLNGDYAVDSQDLGVMFTQWGSCVGCTADLNGDGVVDGQDQGILLTNWTDSHE